MFNNRPVLMLALADMLVVFAVALLGVVFWNSLTHMGLPKIQQVNVYGLEDHIEDLKLQAILQRELTPGYLAVDTVKLASEIATVSFIRRARVVRSMPLALNIYLESHIPVAYWKDNSPPKDELSKPLLINTYAEPFYVENDWHKNLPTLITNATGDELQDRLFREAMVDRLSLWQTWAKLLGSKELKVIRQIRITPGLMWEVEWSGQVKVTLGSWQAQSLKLDTLTKDDAQREGHQEILSLEKLAVLDERMQRFLSAQPTLQKEYGGAPLIVDMRYPSGMAVRIGH